MKRKRGRKKKKKNRMMAELAGCTNSNISLEHKPIPDNPLQVRRQSLIELRIFQKRWKEAVEEDQCWIDPYKEAVKESS
jgi:hypothetical protein